MFQFTPYSPLILCIQIKVPWFFQGGFPHSEISGSKLVYQLPEAYRRLLRLSSPSDAKASTKYPFQLVKIYVEYWLTKIIVRLQITNISKITRNFITTTTLRTALLNWWRWADLNRWPSACKADALPTELHPLHKRIIFRPLHLMVGLSRLERLTSPLSAGRSTTWAIGPENTDYRISCHTL